MSAMIHRTRDGNEIAFRDMTDEHLSNMIALIERKAEEGIAIVSGTYGCSAEDMDAWVEEIYGDDVLDHMNYSEYIRERNRRQRNAKP